MEWRRFVTYLSNDPRIKRIFVGQGVGIQQAYNRKAQIIPNDD